MFICICGVGDALGDAAGIGMFVCIWGVGDGDDFDPPADAGGSDFGVGEGIGIVRWCCACAEPINSTTSNEVSTIRVSGWVKEVARNCWNIVNGLRCL
jgi:hypothetical protein